MKEAGGWESSKGGEKLGDLQDANKIAWEKRSRFFGASLRGVLFKGLPDVVNEHLHHWQEEIILNSIEWKPELKILDIGCGYGRLSLPVIGKFPDAEIEGVDISEHYAALYRENTRHPAFVGPIEDIPSDLGVFDYIICVTVLMYLDNGKLEKATSNLLLHLKQDGRLILIEPHFSGYPFQTACGLLPFLVKRVQKDTLDTRGRYFRSKEVEKRFSKSGGKVLLERRLPMTSLFFVPLTLSGKLLPNRVVKWICKLLALFDDLFSRFQLPSVHVAYLIARE